MVRASILCCILSTVICSFISDAFSQTISNRQMISFIVPGESVGDITLGDTVGVVNSRLTDYTRSAPRQIIESGDSVGCDTTVWVEYSDAGLTMIYCKMNRTLTRIIITTPSLLVRKTNIHVGSNASELSRSYLNASRKQEDSGKGVRWQKYPSEGISFLIDGQTGVVTAIEIYRPVP